jgi:UDP-glucose 4-epimerase
VVGALIKLIEHPQAVGEVYNIGSGNEVTILELANRIKNLVGSNSPIRFLPYDEAYEEGFEDMLRRVPDISKLKSLINYEPRFGLDEILMSVVDYARQKTASRFGAPAPLEFQ